MQIFMRKPFKFASYCCIFLAFGSFLVLKLTNSNLNRNLTAKPLVLKVYQIIVVILSSPQNEDRRNIIRKTWLNLNRESVRHFFVVGIRNFSLRELLNEHNQNGDLLMIDMVDTYQNLTWKLLTTFTILSKKYNGSYLLKVDDDSFVRLDKLIDELKTVNRTFTSSNIQRNFNKNTSLTPFLYWGYFNGNAQIKKSGKWKENNWILTDKYLPYALGGGYVLSYDLVQFFAKNRNFLRLFQAEDVSVGLWLASVENLERRHDIRFDTEWLSRGCQNYHLITHKIDQHQMTQFYENLITRAQLCQREVLFRKPYIYDWGVPSSQCCSNFVSKIGGRGG